MTRYAEAKTKAATCQAACAIFATFALVAGAAAVVGMFGGERVPSLVAGLIASVCAVLALLTDRAANRWIKHANDILYSK